MATYNRAHLITESLATIQNQTYKNWECLIIDDASSDGTAVAVDEFINKDSRFNYHKRTEKYKKGLPGCRNQGLDLAKGNYIIFFDDDDIVHPENLEINFKILQKEGVDFCRYNKEPFTIKPKIDFVPQEEILLRPVSVKDIEEVVTGKLAFASCCVMWKNRCFKDHRFNESLMYAEEWECYLRILSSGFTGVSIDNVLYYNRKHTNSNTGQFWKKDPDRRNSYYEAIQLVIRELHFKKMLTPNLIKWFFRLGLTLRNREIIDTVLNYSGRGFIYKFSYKMGYKIYPLLKPFFCLKSKFI